MLYDLRSSSILWVYRISHMHYSIVAVIVATVVGVVVSLITGTHPLELFVERLVIDDEMMMVNDETDD